jgi:hypothetical protein
MGEDDYAPFDGIEDPMTPSEAEPYPPGVTGNKLPAEYEKQPAGREINALAPKTDVKTELARLIPTAGQIVLSDDQKAILYADVDIEAVEIRPDGLIYLPWMEFATRLRKAFGMEWSQVPDGQPRISPQGDSIIWGFTLVIKGRFVAYAIGEQKYYANNPAMGWGDAPEGAKSNALMRLCKSIGMTLELWKPSFIRDWKKNHAICTDKKWYKKDGGGEKSLQSSSSGSGGQPVAPSTPPRPPSKTTKSLTDGAKIQVTRLESLKYFEAVKSGLIEVSGDTEDYYNILGAAGYEHANQIPLEKIPTIFAELIGRWKDLQRANASPATRTK